MDGGTQVPKAAYTEMPGFFSYVRVRFESLYLLETQHWKKAEQSPVPDDFPDFQAIVFLTRAIAAGHLHDVPAARAAANKQDREGKGEVEISARSMLADMLLDLHRSKEALAQYELSLRTDPNCFNTLLGAARAAAASGNGQTAESYYKQLLSGRENFDNPGLTEARNYPSASH